MKLRDLEIFVVAPPAPGWGGRYWIFTKLTTDDGITGYGDYFTYYSLRKATVQLQQRTHGTVFDTITTETFKTLDCIFPTPQITAAFDKLVEPLLGQIRANLHQSRTLATLRDTLLPKLLSGELSVNESNAVAS